MAEPIVLDLQKISFSGISQYLRCPKQYWFRYVKGIIEPPKIVLIEGSSHHKALEYNNLHKKSRGFDLKASVITDKFVEVLRESVREKELDWRKEEESEDGLIDRGKVWHEGYFKTYAPRIVPEIVEETFEKEIKLGEHKVLFRGVIDLTYKLDSKKRVSDYKTKSAYGFNTLKRGIDHDLQLSFYSWITGIKIVENIAFVKSKNPYVEAVQSERSEKDILWAIQVAQGVVEGIKKESFNPCDPSGWQCSEAYCGYWKHCRGSKA